MGKKNYDSLLSNILGGVEIHPHDKPETSMTEQTEVVSVEKSSKDDDRQEEPWRHFTFICSVELIDKVQAIAHREGFTIRAFMEYMMRQGISQYESKHGKVRKIKVKVVKDVM
jgi:hypothetical protein